MPGLEPLAPHRRPTIERSAMRWRFVAAVILAAALLVAALVALAALSG